MKNKLLLIIFMSQVSLAAPIILTVGPENSCNFNTIQEAVDSGTVDMDIRVSNQENIFTGIQILDGNDVRKLSGGYANCTDALGGIIDELNPYTDIADLSGNDVLYILKSMENTVNLNISGFKFHNGISGVFIASGANNDTLNVGFNYVDVFDNSDSGIRVTGQGTSISIDNAKIYNNNNNLNGGGIYCFESELNLGEYVAVFANTSRKGGGVYAQGCTVNIMAGDTLPLDLIDKGVFNNHASDSGAGVYLNQSILVGSGTTEHPISISNNSITGDQHLGNGGGIYINSGSSLYLINARIDGNFARNAGAAIATNHNNMNLVAPIFTLFNNEQGCEYNEICSSLSKNHTSENGFGDVIFQENGGFGYVVQVKIELNGSANSESIFKTKGGSQLFLISDLIVSNTAEMNVFDQENGSEIYVQYSTLADNVVANYFNIQYDNNIPQILGVTGSIIKNGAASVANLNKDEGNHNAQITCSLIENNDDNGIVQNQSIFGEPGFIGNGNYKLKPNSIAIDSNCSNIDEFDLSRYDIRNQDRNYDQAADLGAYEYISSDDVIFSNNFEH